MEGDVVSFSYRHADILYFNPLPPHGGRHIYAHIPFTLIYISIHSLRMEGDLNFRGFWTVSHKISIHSLRMEGDGRPFRLDICFHISIHSLRMEGDMN